MIPFAARYLSVALRRTYWMAMEDAVVPQERVAIWGDPPSCAGPSVLHFRPFEFLSICDDFDGFLTEGGAVSDVVAPPSGVSPAPSGPGPGFEPPLWANANGRLATTIASVTSSL